VSGPRRLLASGAALTVLLGVVAVASHAHRPGGGSGGGGGRPPELLLEYVAVLALIATVVGGAILVWGVADDRRRRALSGRTNWRRTLVGLALTGAALFLVIHASDRFHLHHHQRPAGSKAIVRPGQSAGKTPVGKQHAPQPLQGAWLTALVLGSVLLGLVLALGLAIRNRRNPEPDDEAALAAALDEVLADTLDDLRAERDPRKAVIQAYARMERTFAAYGVARDPAETPLEYVARALQTLSVAPVAVRRLSLLFERAKFSPHRVDTVMKDDAIETLVALRAELEQEREVAAA
jgi:hypothetical protein